MARVTLLVFALLLAARTYASDCSDATSEADCLALGSCVAVKGEHCKDEMTPPPCGLDFTIEDTESCCDNDNTVEDAEHIKFLGCQPAGQVCGVQCVESLQPQTMGEIFIIWEGCAFKSEHWKDVSNSDECKSCYDDACPSITSYLDWLLLLAFIPFGIAVVIAIALGALAVAAFVRLKYFNDPDLEAYQRMEMSVEMVPVESAEEAKSQEGVDENGVIQARRLADGNIRIPMADGSYRVVSPDAYQKLYLKQQKKRYELYKKSQTDAQKSS